MDGTEQTALAGPAPAADLEAALQAAGDIQARKQLIRCWLDAGRDSARSFWSYVEARGGLALDDWKFVADRALVASVLSDPDNYRVQEYLRRMRGTSGRFYLGLDGAEHEHDMKLGEIIPSWNRFTSSASADPEKLAEVKKVAMVAARRELAAAARRVEIARLTNAQAECKLKAVELLGPVLDACCRAFFGVQAPSAFALVAWARDITYYHFRFQAQDEVDRSPARIASAQYCAHLLSLIAALDAEQPPYDDATAALLANHVASLRRHLSPNEPCLASDNEVAQNLMGIMTGSLTATLRAFSEALLALEVEPADERIRWPEPAQPSAAAAHCPFAHPPPSFPLYDAVVAARLAGARRGSLDAVYRTYQGADTQLGSLAITRGDLVIVWLGGTLDAGADNLFGIGVHKCPGMDMAKALLEGVLQVLTELRGGSSPRRRVVDGEPSLIFEVESIQRLLQRAAGVG